LQVVKHVPDSPSRSEQTHDLTMLRMAGYYALGQLRRIVDELGQIEGLAQKLADQTRLGGVAVTRSGCLAALGEPVPAIEAGERGLAIARAIGHVPLEASATFLLGFAHIGPADFPRSITLFKRTNELPVRRLFGQMALPGVLWRAWMLVPLGEIGAFAEAIASGGEAVRIAEEAAQPYGVALAEGMLGRLHSIRGEVALGIPLLERSVALCREYEIAVIFPAILGFLGHAYALAGRVTEGVSVLEEAVARADELQIMWWQSRRMTDLGEGYLLAHRVDDALKACEWALELADRHGERGNRAYALRSLARVMLHQDRVDTHRAERYLCEALALADGLGMRPLVALCQLDLER